jgi:hypothetical protein
MLPLQSSPYSSGDGIGAAEHGTSVYGSSGGIQGDMMNGGNGTCGGIAHAPLAHNIPPITGGRRRPSLYRTRRFSKRGGTMLAELGVPAALLYANNTFTMGSRGHSGKSHKRSHRRKSKSRKFRKSRR